MNVSFRSPTVFKSVRTHSHVRASFELEDHLPQPVALAALDDLHRFEASECLVRCVKPGTQCLRIEQLFECIGKSLELTQTLLTQALWLGLAGFPVSDRPLRASHQAGELASGHPQRQAQCRD